jgi:hypothetical protein
VKIESVKDHGNEVDWYNVTKAGRRPVLVNCQRELTLVNSQSQPSYNFNSDEPVGRLEQKTLICDKAAIVNKARKRRILIIGNSHVKGLAMKLQHNLVKDYAVQEIVKSGADMDVILNSNVNEIRNLAKDDSY